jgi:kynurenine formamidase
VAQDVTSLDRLLHGSPDNWGRWGADDEVGALNFLGPKEVMNGATTVTKGKVFTLQVAMCDPRGDPISPERRSAQRLVTQDKGHYLANKASTVPGGLEYADDLITTCLHGTTHCDALGHAWHGDRIWNGRDASTTIGGLSFASVLPIASKGIVGRGVLLDLARHRDKDVLDRGETFSHADLIACASEQGTEIQTHDIIVIRTGWLGMFYSAGAAEWRRDFREPGLTYSAELVAWFDEMEISSLVTDTMSNEVLIDPSSGAQCPLHVALMAKLGIVFLEVAWLEELADDCAADGTYEFLFAAAPLKVVDGSGAPVNPIAIK